MSLEINNKKAYFDYFIEDKIEVGIVLEGKEVKSIRQGKCNLKGSWCNIEHGEMFVLGMHISNYQDSCKDNLFVRVDPYRTRKLLLHKRELRKLEMRKKLEGVTFIPLKIYEKDGKFKMLLGVCTGKKKQDKRESLKRKDIEREISRERKG